jgi:hypothetical protein
MTMPKRISVYAGKPIEDVLLGYDDNRSGRLNQVAESYLEMVKCLTPEMTEPEWSAVVDALNGYWMDEALALRYAWAEIADTKGLGKKWGVDQEALSGRIRSLTDAELIALREVIKRLWRHSDLTGPAALQAAGARISSDEQGTRTP